MLIKTLLNRIEKFKSFVYGTASFEEVDGHTALVIDISPRKNAQPLCPKCDWTKRTMYSKLKPMKKVARMLRNHKDLILNWFRADGKVSNSAVEGLNLKAKLAMRKAYGFRNVKTLQIALYHTLGNLPEPKITHRFC